MKSRRVLVYGAGGHTGSMIARRLRNRGVDVVVAGRPSSRLTNLGGRLKCECRTADIDSHSVLVDMLRDVAIAVNAAGPFAVTASKLVCACVGAGCHYLDI